MIDAFVALVTQTWRIVSRTPALWIIGAVGALCGGLGSVSAGPEPLEMVWESNSTTEITEVDIAQLRALFERFADLRVLWSLGALVVAIGLVSLFIGAWMEAGLIAVTDRAQAGDRVDWQGGLDAGWARVWPVFFIRLLIGVSVVVPLLAPLAAAIVWIARLLLGSDMPGAEQLLPAFGVFFAVLLPLICLLALASLVFGWLEIVAVRAAVLEELNVWAAIKRGWALLRGRLVWFVGWWLFVAAGNAAIASVAARPLSGLRVVFAGDVDFGAAIGSLALMRFLLVSIPFWLVAAGTGGALHVFVSSFWTLAYKRLAVADTGEGVLQ